jgi:hypothetical protein
MMVTVHIRIGGRPGGNGGLSSKVLVTWAGAGLAGSTRGQGGALGRTERGERGTRAPRVIFLLTRRALTRPALYDDTIVNGILSEVT